MTRAELAGLLRLLAANYRDFAVDDANKVALWWSYFRGIPVREAIEAVHAYVGESKFRPTIADILERVRGTAKDLAVKLWHEEVLPAIRNNDPRRLRHPLAQRVVQQHGGLGVLGERPTDQALWTMHRFVERCVEYSRTPEARELLGTGDAKALRRLVGAGGSGTVERLVTDVSRRLEAPE